MNLGRGVGGDGGVIPWLLMNSYGCTVRESCHAHQIDLDSILSRPKGGERVESLSGKASFGKRVTSFTVVVLVSQNTLSQILIFFQTNKVMIAPEIEPKLTEAQVRAALLSHISAHCCYGKAAARNMVVKKMEYLPAYHYELQTFTEKRETAWTYAAIRTGYESLMGSNLGSGIPPLPWEIFEEPAQAFKDEVRLVQVVTAYNFKHFTTT